MASHGSLNEMVRKLADIVSSRGYECYLDRTHPHPRFYFGTAKKKRFIILSTTQNYNGGGNLDKMKIKDLEREMAHLPSPDTGERVKITADTAAALGKAASGQVKLSDIKIEETKPEPVVEQRPEPMPDPFEKSPISWPISLRSGGKGSGGLTIFFPCKVKDEFFADASGVDLIYIEGKHIGIAFSQNGRFKIGSVRGGKSYQVYIPRAELPFDLTQGSISDQIFGKATNNALVSKVPLPKQFLTGFAPVKGANTMADGIAARKLLNDWLARAKSEGMDPEVVFDPKTCTISICVAEVRKVTL